MYITKKSMLILSIILILIFKVSYAEDEAKLFYNDKQLVSDVSPFIENDRVLVPIRVIMEAFGFSVLWDEATTTVNISSDQKNIILTKDSDTAIINGKNLIMDVCSKIVENRIFVPIRFVAENFGYDISWDENTRSVLMVDRPEELSSVLEKTINPNKAASPDAFIEKIFTESVSDILRLVIVSDKNIPVPKSMTLENPSRYVLDFEKSILDVSFNELSIGSNIVDKVRFAQNSLNPNIVRVVLDLKGAAIVSATLNGSLYVIDVIPQKDDVVVTDLVLDYDAPISEKLVVLDPGHGGKEPGSKGIYEGREILEKDINLYIGNKVYEILKDKGINVITTRQTDATVSLQERVQIANNAGATLFVSIHNNAFDKPDAKGTLTLYAYDSPKEFQVVSDLEVATIMQKELIKGTSGYNRNLLKNPNIYVTRATTMPALLCECLFMTNPDDLRILMDNTNLDKIAESIAAGTIKCLDILPVIKHAEATQ